MDSICCHAAWKKPAVSAIQKHRYAPEFLLILPFPSPCQETVRIFDSILLLPANCSARRRELPVLLSRFSFGLDFNLIIGLFFAKPVSRADPSPPERERKGNHSGVKGQSLPATVMDTPLLNVLPIITLLGFGSTGERIARRLDCACW